MCARAASSPLTPEAWRDLSALDDEGLGTRATTAPAMLCRFPLPTGVPPPAPANRHWTHAPLHPGTSSRAQLGTLRGSTACVTARPELTDRVLMHASVPGAQVPP